MAVEEITRSETNETAQLAPEEQAAIQNVSKMFSLFQEEPNLMGFDALGLSINLLLHRFHIDEKDTPKNLGEMDKKIQLKYDIDNYSLIYSDSERLITMSFDKNTLRGIIKKKKIHDKSLSPINQEIRNDEIDSKVNEIEQSGVDIGRDNDSNEITGVVDKDQFMKTLKTIVEEVIPQIVENELKRGQNIAKDAQTIIRKHTKGVEEALTSYQPEYFI